MTWSDLPTRFPATTLIGRVLRWPLRWIDPTRPRRILSGPARGLQLIPQGAMHGYWLGTYERESVETFAAAIQSGMTVWDVGANIGYYTLLARRLVGPAGQVVAIEPLPVNLAALRAHLALNGFGDVDVVEAAAAATSGTARFRMTDSPGEGYFDGDGEIEVATIALDTLTERLPHVVKIDVEGFADLVLRGADRILEHHPVILLATHPRTGEPARCRGILDRFGYTVRPTRTDPDVWICH